ncbi:putative Zn-dependent protease [Duganella sp. 3397]|uniref:cellulose synthase subunit BcsC-related outer membrane protein n=1 Tax=Duganella sp. 3397 TaxID=2817732 RepID=UPI00286654E5|nr:cellulose synthase subunit BcsC-related outer membrane protein [Duganella sp. 3397]MDR7051403.1 putative Zn-dependent protease [Duganella sp. 3397]
MARLRPAALWLAAACLAAPASTLPALAASASASVPTPAARADTGAVDAVLRRASFWEERGNDELALVALDKVLRLAPDHQDALGRLAMIELRLQRAPAAAAAIARLQRLNPRHPALALYQAQQKQQQGDGAQRWRSARALARSGRVDEALRIMDAMKASQPLDSTMQMDYYQVLARTKDGRDKAHLGLRELLRQQPDNIALQLAVARLDLNQRPNNGAALTAVMRISAMPRFGAAARDIWRSAMLALDPEPASLVLIDRYMQDESGEDSAVREQRAALVRGIEQRRQLLADPGYRAHLDGLALLEAGQLEQAEQKFNQALLTRPNDGDVLGGLGTVYLRQGLHDQAQQQFQRAQRADPEQQRRWKSMERTARFWGLMRAARDATEGAAGAVDYALAARLLGQARELDPGEPAVLLAQARLAELRGNHAEAEKLLRQALAVVPEPSGARADTVEFFQRQGRDAEAEQLAAQAPPAQRQALQRDIALSRATRLQQQGDALVAAGDARGALELYEQAAALDDADPWLRYAMARAYAAQGEPQRGFAAFDQLLAAHPDDPTARYAYALFQGNQAREAEALAMLATIKPEQRTPEMQRQAGRFEVGLATQRARAQALSGARTAALAGLQAAAQRYAAEPDRLLDLADAMADIEAPSAALAALKVLPKDINPDQAIRSARILSDAGASAEALAVLNGLQPATLSAQDATAWDTAADAIALATARRLRGARQYPDALQALAPRLAAHDDSAPLRAERARIERAMGQPAPALASYRKLQALEPDNASHGAALVELLVETGQRTEARAEIDRLLAGGAPQDPQVAADLASALVDLDDQAGAARLVWPALAAHPGNLALLDRAGGLAVRAGQVDQAIGYYQQGNALAGPVLESYRVNRLAELLDKREAWVSSALNHEARSGTPGLSQLGMDTLALEYKLRQPGPDRVALRADIVDIRGGLLDPALPDARNAGTVLLCFPRCTAPAASQNAHGIALNAGWERGPWKADVGTTPLGFPVTTLVGGVTYQGDLGPVGYAVEASRRALTSSLLSYAGMTDPATGKVWGGVTQNGMTLSASRDDGGALGLWTNAGVHSFTGKDVQTNRRLQWMGGLIGRVINTDNRLLSVGVTAMVWRFTKNVGEYTFGHGGYYSPASYKSVSLPVTYGERIGRLSFTVRGAVSRSLSQTRAADYFPTDSALQSQADALVATNFFEPRYGAGAGTSKSVGRSLATTLEYQVRKNMFIGGSFSLDRSIDYAPNRFMLYLRFAPDGVAARPVPFPPVPAPVR